MRSTDWRFALATPEPEKLAFGTPLAEFCSELFRGVNTSHTALDYESPGTLQVVDRHTLAGSVARRWAATNVDGLVYAKAGDILVAAAGAFANATVATEPAVVSSDVYVISLHNRQLSRPIANYLNSQTGFGHRQMLLKENLVGSLNRTDLLRIPVLPETVGDPNADKANDPPIAHRLEQALWEL